MGAARERPIEDMVAAPHSFARDMVPCLTCPYRCGGAGEAPRSSGPEQKITPTPEDVSVYRLTQNDAGALVSCRITVVIADIEVDAIVDTGAARTILSSLWYQEMLPHLPPLRPCTSSLQGAGARHVMCREKWSSSSS